MSKPSDDPVGNREPWQPKFGEMVFRRQYTEAFRLLEKVIEHDMPLFWGVPAINESRRLAWLYRIDLLRTRGRLTEALAWACLECEINPTSVTAQALKARLKRVAGWETEAGRSASARARKADARVLWPGVAGMRELKAILERDVILSLLEPDLYKRYKVALPNGVLFYGPPGCGKTFIARKLAEVLGFHYIEVKPSDLASIYVHGTQGKIGELFKQARKNAPCLLFFDELDALVPSRGESLNHHYAAEVNEFLSQLSDCSTQRVLVVGATNYLSKIDAAIQRPGRFDKKVYIGLPDLEARADLLKLYMADRPQNPVDWIALAKECEGHTCAELELIVNEAARRALARRRAICADDLIAGMATVPAAHADARAEET